MSTARASAAAPGAAHPATPGGPRAEDPPGGPLASVRVVELADERVAFAGKLLAELGAEVTVVEPPGGSPCRDYGPFAGDVVDRERSLWWWHYQVAKRSVVADLSTEAGRRRLFDLLDGADIVLEGYESGRLERLGLGPDQVRATRPALLWVTITPFGRERPRSAEPATDLTVMCEGGPVWSCGYDDHTLAPVRGGSDHAMQIAGIHAVIGVLAAMVHRDVTAIGQHVDVSMHAAANVTTEAATYHWLVARETVQRQTCRHASQRKTADTMAYDVDGRPVNTGMPPRGAHEYQALVEWLRDLGLLEEFPEAFMLQLGIERGGVHLAEVREPGLAQEIFGAGRDALRLILTRLSAHEFFVQGQRRGLAVGIINSPDEVIEDPHFVARGFPRPLLAPAVGRQALDVGAPWRFTGSPVTLRVGAPLLDQHGDIAAVADASAQPGRAAQAVQSGRSPGATA